MMYHGILGNRRALRETGDSSLNDPGCGGAIGPADLHMLALLPWKNAISTDFLRIIWAKNWIKMVKLVAEVCSNSVDG